MTQRSSPDHPGKDHVRALCTLPLFAGEVYVRGLSVKAHIAIVESGLVPVGAGRGRRWPELVAEAGSELAGRRAKRTTGG